VIEVKEEPQDDGEINLKPIKRMPRVEELEAEVKKEPEIKQEPRVKKEPEIKQEQHVKKEPQTEKPRVEEPDTKRRRVVRKFL
jgi:hypothetical protein